MMGFWRLPLQPEFGSALPFDTTDVLAEYDGPQIVLARGPGGRFLGVAADEDDDAVRWIYAPVTMTELRALALGALATRNAILKPVVFIVDMDRRQKPARVWQSESYTIGEENLPDPGARLPAASREYLRAKLEMSSSRPELRFERPSVRTSAIPFRALSETLSAHQRFWTAISYAVRFGPPKGRGRLEADLGERATLSLAAATEGSLVLAVEPTDEGLFQEASLAFEELVAAGDDTEQLTRALERLGPRVQGRYAELLLHAERHDLQILAQRPGGATFIGPAFATRIRFALPQATPSEPRTVPAVGSFVAFDTDGSTFEFFDEASDTTYKGSVHPDVLAQHTSVAVGPGTTYAVFVEVTRFGQTASSERHVLRAIANTSAQRPNQRSITS